MKSSIFVDFLLMVILLFETAVNGHSSNKGNAVYDYSYIQTQCRQTINVGNSYASRYGFVLAHPSGNYYVPDRKNCTLRLLVPKDYRLTLRFASIDIKSETDKLYIIGATNTRNYSGYNIPPYSLYSSSNWLNLTFTSGPSDRNRNYTGFRLYYTSYHFGKCKDNEYKCSIDGRCIPKEVKCDGFDNCGDWSDERVKACGLSTGAIIGISVTCTLIGLSFIAMCVYCVYDSAKRRKNSRIRTSPSYSTETSASRPTVEPTLPPSYEPPPVYTIVNTVYAGVYDDDVPDENKPPSYKDVTIIAVAAAAPGDCVP